MKSIINLLTISTLVIASNASASLITFDILGDVTYAENYGGLTNTDYITATITLDDTGLTGIGFETIYFTGSNTLDITAGSLSFNQSMENATSSIMFNNGLLFDFNFGATIGENGALESFDTSGTSVLTHREVTTGNGANQVTTNHTLHALWDKETVYITAVPVPAAVWLFGSGLLGLVGVARRKAA